MSDDILDMLRVDVSKAQAAREENRRRMPNAAATLDAYREAFGDDTKLVRAIEDGPEGRVFVGKWTDEEKAAVVIEDIKPGAKVTACDRAAAAKKARAA